MKRAKSPLLSALLKFNRAGLRQASRVGKAATAQGLASSRQLMEQAGRVLNGVATPAEAPRAVSGGRWLEGRWGLGPLAMRRYRLFIPSGATARKPWPLLLLLHGCAQDVAAFAASTRVASVAKASGFAVLMAEQAQEANPQRCWNWFGNDFKVGLEAQILLALVDHAVAAYPRIGGPLFALGLSAGGAMAASLGVLYPQRFTAVGSHAGAAPFSADTALQAAQAMTGRRGPDGAEVALRLAGQRPPPLLLIHGDADHVVSYRNAEAAAALWLAQLPSGTRQSASEDAVRRGNRRALTRCDWRADGKPYVRLLKVHGLGHAWSGGAAGQAFSDPSGPDALRLAWRFFSSIME